MNTISQDARTSDMHDIRDALNRAVKTVTLRPERGQRIYRNVAFVGQGTQCEVDEAGRHLTIDVGKALGGKDEGPNPSMILRSAISSCVAIGIKQWAARLGVDVEFVEVVFETAIDARGQLGVCDETTPGFESMSMSMSITSSAGHKTIEEIVETALRYSPLMDVILNQQRVERQVTVIGAEEFDGQKDG